MPRPAPEADIKRREDALRAWWTHSLDKLQAAVDGLDIGWGGVQS